MNILLTLLFGVSYSLSALMLDQGSGEEAKKTQLVQLARLYQEEQKAWPGLQWNEAPLIVSFGEKEVYALGLNGDRTVWQEIDIEGEKLLFTAQNPENVARERLHPFFPIEEQEAFVFKMSGPRAVKILAHERFHRFQMDHFEEGDSAAGYAQHLNAENVALMAVEEALLQEFVQKGSLESLEQYAAVHRERVELIDEDSLAWEEMQQRFEGLADYVAAKMSGEESQVLAKLEEDDLVENAMKWRHYGVGAALGLALDALNVKEWKEQVQEGASLGNLLDQALTFTKDQDRALAKKAKQRFQYKKKKKKIEQQIAKYQKLLRNIDEEFLSMEGPSLKIGKLDGVGISGGGRSEAIYYLTDGSQVIVKDQSFSGSMDGRWTFETKEPTTLYQRSEGYREVKAMSEVDIVIDDQAFQEEVDCPREYPFQSLSLDSLAVSLQVKDAFGILVHSGDQVEVKFLSN